MIVIEHLDHLVLTVRDLDRTVAFYTAILGMQAKPFGQGRLALHFGQQKINLHLAGQEFDPKAKTPLPGSADLCFLIRGTVAETTASLAACGAQITEGPVPRTGATGPVISLYLRDPDGNLIELAHPALP